MKLSIAILMIFFAQTASAFDAFGRFLDTSPFVFRFGDGAGDAKLYGATSVHADGDKIYVSEGVNSLKIFNLNGEFLEKKVGFNLVFSITSSSSRIFLTAPSGLQILDKNMNLITTYPTISSPFSSVAFNSANSQIILSENGYSNLRFLTSAGVFVKQCATSISPSVSTYDSLATSSTRIFVPDHSNLKIKVFDYNCNLITVFGSSGTGLGQFQNLRSLHFNSKTNLLYVADRYSIQVFNENGMAIKRWNYSSGNGKGYFSYLSSVSSTGDKLVVGDSSGERVNILAPF